MPMNGARRFLRYIFPGMIFFVLLFLYLFISTWGKVLDDVGSFMKGTARGGGVLEAGVFILFVAGAGYLFATIYHTFVKRFPQYRKPDHSGQVRDAIRRNWLIVIRRGILPDESAGEEFNSSQAWSITGAYYHAMIHKKEFKEAHVRIESLNDTLHGLGASCVASIFALIVWIVFHKQLTYSDSGWIPWLISLAVGVLIVVGFCWNYWHTGIEVENMLDGIAFKLMEEESKPIKLYFPV